MFEQRRVPVGPTFFPMKWRTFVGFASSSVAFVALGNPFGSSPGAPHGNGIYKSTNASSCSATFTPLTARPSGAIHDGPHGSWHLSQLCFGQHGLCFHLPMRLDASTTNLGVWVTTTAAPPGRKQRRPTYANSSAGTTMSSRSIRQIRIQCFLRRVLGFGCQWKPPVGCADHDGGTSWSTVIPNQLGVGLPHVDTHALAFFKLPGGKVRLYLGNDGGIWRTDDAEACDHLVDQPERFPAYLDAVLSVDFHQPSLAVHRLCRNAGQWQSELSGRRFLGG